MIDVRGQQRDRRLRQVVEPDQLRGGAHQLGVHSQFRDRFNSNICSVRSGTDLGGTAGQWSWQPTVWSSKEESDEIVRGADHASLSGSLVLSTHARARLVMKGLELFPTTLTGFTPNVCPIVWVWAREASARVW